MPGDYSHYLLEMQHHAKKATAYLESSQSVGPMAKAVAMANAESKLLEAIASARQALAAIRNMQTPRAWQD
jgi:hypothetical protein